MRVVCPTMHAEQLHLAPVWAATRADLVEVAAALDHLHRSVAGTNRGIRSARPVRVVRRSRSRNRDAHASSPAPRHTRPHHRIPDGTAARRGRHPSLPERELRVPRRAWAHTEGFLVRQLARPRHDGRMVVGDGLRVRLHAPHLFGRASQLDPRPERAACRPSATSATSSRSPRRRRSNSRCRPTSRSGDESVDVEDLSYELYYLHDYDLVAAKKRAAVRGLGTLQRFAHNLTVHQLLERIGPTVDQ